MSHQTDEKQERKPEQSKPLQRKSLQRKSWTLGSPELVHPAYVFDLYKRHVITPENHQADYYFLHSKDWVNVIPITTDNRVILIRQFRPNINDYCLEIPGGLLDSDTEDPVIAAARELREETGYTSSNFESLGSVYPNPAIQDNLCHFYAAFDATLSAETAKEPGEDITVVEVPLQQLPQLILDQEINHAVMLPALLKLLLRLKLITF